MLKECLENVRAKKPLVHNITNYVTVNDVANMLLACGGSPIMAHEVDEVEDIQTICGGLCVNIGTLGMTDAMVLAGKKANALGHPVVLDPVAAGASKARKSTVERLMSEVRFAAIRGNISEIKCLAIGTETTRGVDAAEADAVNGDNLDEVILLAKKLAAANDTVIAITGATDIVADKDRAYVIKNGHPMMSSITGSGCMLSALTAAYIIANPDHPLDAAAAAVICEGVAGEKAYELTSKEGSGNASFRTHLIDAVCLMTGDELEKGAKYEIR